MIVLIDSDLDGIVAAAALAVRYGWPYRLSAAATVLASEDEILLHAADADTVPNVRGALLATPAPIVALASPAWLAATDWSAQGYVAAVEWHRLSADLPGVIAEWRHDTRLATIERLAATFGAAPIAGLLQGLRHALEAALHAPMNMSLVEEAHRIAGVAGSLGFAALGRHWLRISQRGSTIDAGARRATVHALATLDRAKNCPIFTVF